MPPNVCLPLPLKRPLRFGDAEQIAALKQWLAAIRDDDTVFETDVKWEVTYLVEKTRTVYAISKADAEESAFDEEPGDIDEIVSITRIQEET